MLWLSRYADLSESSFQLDAAKQEIEWCIAPFRESARTLVRSLLRCLISLDEVRCNRPMLSALMYLLSLYERVLAKMCVMVPL